jgi:VanZ family protein
LSWRLTAAIICLLVIYGAIDEYLQGVLTTQRKPEWKDWVMDAMGATAGVIVAAALAKRWSK